MSDAIPPTQAAPSQPPIAPVEEHDISTSSPAAETAADDAQPVPKPTGSDAKAAAAMSNLSSNMTATSATTPSAPKQTDQNALIDAMKRLEAGGAAATAGKSDGETPRVRTPVQIRAAEERARVAEEEKRIKAVKVDAAHVTLLVDQLDVTKVQATDLLRRHDADPVRAMTAWVTSAV